jgi:hypothetical protein
MVEIVMPALVRVFRAVDKDIFIYRWMNGHHANVRALSGTVEDLNLPVSTFTRSMVSPVKEAPEGRTSKTSHRLSAVQARVLVS